ncbi:MAG TPA: RNA polymerase sigma factor [Ignavibacteriaceae bacterium]|nr:RNA polymerase sigma factor [Ignavibacteriaceae bacterium]
MADSSNDFELVRKFTEGDESAFNKIVLKYQQKIYWHARRMTGNHLDADEVVQEVLMVMFEKLKDFKFQSSLYTWIYRVTSTRSINFINKRKIKQILSFEDQGQDSIKNKEDIIADIETKEKLEKLERILQKVPPRQREIFILKNYEQLTYEEMAEVTGKSIGGLKSNYFQAMKKIMKMVKEDE